MAGGTRIPPCDPHLLDDTEMDRCVHSRACASGMVPCSPQVAHHWNVWHLKQELHFEGDSDTQVSILSQDFLVPAYLLRFFSRGWGHFHPKAMHFQWCRNPFELETKQRTPCLLSWETQSCYSEQAIEELCHFLPLESYLLLSRALPQNMLRRLTFRF